MMIKQWWVILALALAGGANALPGDTVLVTAVNGRVAIENVAGQKMALEPFVRLREGDRLTLPAAATVSLVFVAKARQESWQGPGSLLVGDGEGKAVVGEPQLKVRNIPPEIARQMTRTPVASADGRVGMIRTRSIPQLDNQRLEREYREMRAQATATDILPEIYLLAGLLELRQFDRLEEELKRIAAAYPQDANVPALRQLYTKALIEAREGK